MLYPLRWPEIIFPGLFPSCVDAITSARIVLFPTPEEEKEVVMQKAF